MKYKILIITDLVHLEKSPLLKIAYKAVLIVLIPNEYYQFRVWSKLNGTNFNSEEYIGSIAKNTGVQCFRFVFQKDFLKYSLLEMSNRYVIVYMICSCYCELLWGIWQTCFKLHWLYLFKQSVVQLFSTTILLVYIWSTSLLDNLLHS